ncbi:hypothetical protein Godav_020153, partial [Gossypium davidsonii]|nr:hypothetical protein [Gossypium davidsonii]
VEIATLESGPGAAAEAEAEAAPGAEAGAGDGAPAAMTSLIEAATATMTAHEIFFMSMVLKNSKLTESRETCCDEKQNLLI